MIYGKDLGGINRLIHCLNKKVNNEKRQYKIFSLSIPHLTAHGSSWVTQIHDMYKPLENQGEAILIMENIETGILLKSESFKLDLASMIEFQVSKPKNVYLVTTSLHNTMESYFPLSINLTPKTESKTIPNRLTEVKIEESVDSALTMTEFRNKELQEVLDVIGSDQPQQNVFLIGEEEEETLGLVQDMAEQFRKTPNPSFAGCNIYSINLKKLLNSNWAKEIEPLIQFLENTNGILFITDVEKYIQSFLMGKPTLDPKLSDLLENPKLKLLLWACCELEIFF